MQELQVQKGQLEQQKQAVAKETEEQRELIARYDVAIGKARRMTEAEIVDDILLLEDSERQESIVLLLLDLAKNNGEDVYRATEGALRLRDIAIPSRAGDDDGDSNT
jgi:hypothetical protein